MYMGEKDWKESIVDYLKNKRQAKDMVENAIELKVNELKKTFLDEKINYYSISLQSINQIKLNNKILTIECNEIVDKVVSDDEKEVTQEYINSIIEELLIKKIKEAF